MAMNDTAQLYFEDFSIGDRFTGRRRTVTQEDFQRFAALTGDAHPIHYDAEYAAATRFGRPLAHGLLLMAWTALGATDFSRRLEGSMVAFIEQGCRFIAPVFVGDAITPFFTVESIDAPAGLSAGRVRFAVEIERDDGMPCLSGFHVYQLRHRPAEGSQPA